MFLIKTDFTKRDKFGRLSLSTEGIHKNTGDVYFDVTRAPAYGKLSRLGDVAFVDGTRAVRGEIVHDSSQGWVADVDWTTEFSIESPMTGAVSPASY